MEEEIKIDDDFILIRFQNNTDEVAVFQRPIQLGLIQFHFGLKGSANYNFNHGNYSLKLKEEKALLFYNTEKELPLNVEIDPKTWLISIFVSIKKFHGLFTTDAENIPFLSKENKEKKYYNESDISPSMAIVLNQMFHYNLNPSIKNLV